MTPLTKNYLVVDANPDFVKIEERVLNFWKREKIFEASVAGRADSIDGKNNEFIFYDGPPFANGLPHYGHLLTSFVKDVFARYQTMRGKRVERRFGWDCHGLPAEMGAEKELGISGRQAITQYGIGKFNDYCRTSVMKYTREWEYYVSRAARWVDFEHDYKTMDKSYMESVLWAFKQLYDKGLIYEAYRVMPYSWAAETPLSNFETRLDNSYREREDRAITVAFELDMPPKGAPEAEKYFVLAWTTTPWTLPSNLALAVNSDLEYGYVTSRDGAISYICSPSYLHTLLKALGDDPTSPKDYVWTPLRGVDLLGLTYKPLFLYFAKHPNYFRILDGSDFVTDTDGTGIVHMAPGFGEDDQRCCEANGIELVCPVDGSGRFTDEIYDIDWVTGLPPTPPSPSRGEGLFSLKGKNVLEENLEKYKFGEVNELIIKWLKEHGNLIGNPGQIKHNYPHCWRTDKPLIYRAVPSWYVEVTKFRDRMVTLNQQINWIPGHVKDGLFGKWLENARDWSISRNRFWGTPIPVWKSKSGKIKVFGSIAELEKASGQTITDLHRPQIDAIVITDGGEEYTRVEDVFDCWFESGSMPYAQVHYPFENKHWFEDHFPADFITEYVAQTRGWFYTLMVLSTALFDKPPFKNCICHGVVIDDETGLKYSKRLKNYKDPKWVFDTFGSDALRWLMLSSPVMRGLDLSVDPEGKFIRDVVRLNIKPIWNAYNFFCLYANADGVKAALRTDSDNLMDRYILAKCKLSVEQIATALDTYDTPSACESVSHFFEALNNWYIRRSKARFWKEGRDGDKQAAYDTLYTVLVTMCKAAAPLLPLTLEDIFKGLTYSPIEGESQNPSAEGALRDAVGSGHTESTLPLRASRSAAFPHGEGNSSPIEMKSVHLADYPSLRGGNADEAIQTEMDIVRDVCNAAHAIRNRLNIRVRQPLSKLTIMGVKKSLNDEFYKSTIMDEVNVKEIEIKNTLDSHYGAYRLQINFPVLGKRLPAKIKEIIPASKKAQFNWSPKGDGSIIIAGVEIMPEEFSLLLEPSGDFKNRAQPLSTNDALVILDTHITPELEAEGYARDLVRLIQQARKDSGLRVSDRIHLRIRVSDKLVTALELHHGFIAEQVLATSLDVGDMRGCTFIINETIENEEVSIGFTVKAAAA